MTGFDNIYKAYKEADADPGLVGIPILPRGTYPVKIVNVNSGTSSAKGTPYVTLQVEVLEGPFKGKRTRLQYWLCKVTDPALGDAVQAWYACPPEDRKEKLDDNHRKLAGNFFRAKGLMEAVGVQPADIRKSNDADLNALALKFYNADAWVGKTYLCGMSVETAERQESQALEQGRDPGVPEDRNRPTSWKKLDEAALTKWRAKELPRQVKVFERMQQEQQAQKTGQTAAANSNL